MELPKALQQFLSEPIVMEMMCLPYHYPEINQFEDFQDGYRINGNTGEDLTGVQNGDWLPEYYVICQNYFADPFMIKMNESSEGFPVYYARHGCGWWDFEKISPNLQAFKDELLYFSKLDENTKEYIQYLETQKDLKSELWAELYQSLKEGTPLQAEIEDVELHVEIWIYGKLILTTIGENKIKIAHFLKQHFKITGAEALALTDQLPIVLGHFAEKFAVNLQVELRHLGAEVIFIADE